MQKRGWVIITSGVLTTIVLFFFYQQTYVSVWGFQLSNGYIKDVIVYTEDKVYLITDEQMVHTIVADVSRMKKSAKVNGTDIFDLNSGYTKILIRTIDNTTYGGNLVKVGENIYQNSAGYYWSFDYENFSTILSQSIETASILREQL